MKEWRRKKWLMALVVGVVFGYPLVSYFVTHRPGNVKHVEKSFEASVYFSATEIEEASAVIFKKFSKDWRGATLNEIEYTDEHYHLASVGLTEREGNKRENIIVFMAKFNTGALEGGNFLPHTEVDNWMYILQREYKDGDWVYIGSGI